ncbi:redoxin domain-containing protein [Fulvivirga sp. 29W222]|uniref:Redoxin domain-containing protein n=1 Tax=Fulvivirga marina TaxID=2494733 RepID=A0A937FZJ8_9BACT|nr:TlpA disulfide reductase family protein [Fulvivirga marina]MBL6449035.1 redoxin domain-containing protein [Fulvivirga marina]
MNFLRILMISVVSFWACSSNPSSEQSTEGTINLSGTVGYPQNGQIILEKFNGNVPVPYDTITLNEEDYTFSQHVKVESPGYYRLNFYGRQFVPLILDKDDVVVNVDGNNQQGFFEVKGSRDHDFISEVQEMASSFQSSEPMQKINERFKAASQSGDQVEMDAIRDEYVELDEKFKEQIMAKIDSLGASLGVVEILKSGRYLDKDKHHEFFVRYATLLDEEMPNSSIAQEFVSEVEKSKKLAIGQVAPEIALPNPDGEIVKLSSLRGNYVLVDFWAKWCKPCRMENPNVVRMYNKYNEKGFEVFGVSLDRKREDWLEAIEQDQLHWTQVSDLKFWGSEAARLYNVNSIPFALLLDPEGKIIGKNLRGKELENKLEEIFSSQAE